MPSQVRRRLVSIPLKPHSVPLRPARGYPVPPSLSVVAGRAGYSTIRPWASRACNYRPMRHRRRLAAGHRLCRRPQCLIRHRRVPRLVAALRRNIAAARALVPPLRARRHRSPAGRTRAGRRDGPPERSSRASGGAGQGVHAGRDLERGWIGEETHPAVGAVPGQSDGAPARFMSLGG